MENRDFVEGLDSKLKEARIAAGLSQIEAAERAEVAQYRISQYELGKKTPTLAVLLRLAVGYGVDVASLLPPTPTPKRPSGPPAAPAELSPKRPRAKPYAKKKPAK